MIYHTFFKLYWVLLAIIVCTGIVYIHTFPMSFFDLLFKTLYNLSILYSFNTDEKLYYRPLPINNVYYSASLTTKRVDRVKQNHLTRCYLYTRGWVISHSVLSAVVSIISKYCARPESASHLYSVGIGRS